MLSFTDKINILREKLNEANSAEAIKRNLLGAELRKAAEAQRQMAANAQEDSAHWHHVYLADLLGRAQAAIR